MIPVDDLIDAELPRGPCPVDAYLREAAFRIESRPKNGPPMWERAGRSYTETEAFAVAKREAQGRDEAEKAKRAE